ncbi:MAG: ABC transporter substrate-binding protein [Alphaproteobacteria bacterium]|nr:ABC transporter substrate-binding protein [Alphaproteobacteria bacterium]
MVQRCLTTFFAVLLAACVVSTPASRAEVDGPVGFIERLGVQAIEMLADPALTEQEQISEFRRILVAAFDLPTIARFVLGRYWRRATTEERREFESLLEDYIVTTYAARLGRYRGETLAVGAARGEGDILVASEIIPHEGPPVRVDWRVRGGPGSYKIVDVVVEGISMVITQRSAFASVIQRSGGRVSGLLSELRKKAGRR